MPQMAPMAWMTLMIMFITTIIMTNTLMYFNKKYFTKTNFNNNIKNKMNWKW
uniref:ATP synthase F0 subunit 8 n=1 Tax=Metrocoris tenuicornis TaxID=3095937 RepID=A0AB38Z6N7_9HEMI|nr:ATP synthase F0 subunit 8 [Metrocoris tenuicornis]WPW47038.1 ATP synthase F0 subunit 8 [Metrocoris tenuicornis]